MNNAKVRVILDPEQPDATMLGRMTVEQITPRVEQAYLAGSLGNKTDAVVKLTYRTTLKKWVIQVLPDGEPAGQIDRKTVYLIEKYLDSSGLPVVLTSD